MKKEIVVSGYRHSDIFKMLKDFNINIHGVLYEQGFLTSKGNFVCREDAAEMVGLKRKNYFRRIYIKC